MGSTSTRRTGAVALTAVAVLALGCAPGTDDARDDAQDTVERAAGSPSPSADEPAGRAAADLPEHRRAQAPWEVVRQVEASELAVRDERTAHADLVAAGRLNQLAYRTLAERPGWDDRVRELLAPRFASVVRDNVAARRDMLGMQRSYAAHDSLPAWRIAPPEPAADLRAHYEEAEAEFGVGWEYLAAINLIETGMGRIRGDSVADARGPMQFIDATWEQYGEGDVTDPRDAIMAAGRYLSARGFTAGDREAVDGALYAYNNHPAYVRAIRRHAEVMEREPRAYLGYYHYDVVFLTERGDVTLPVGYDESQPVPVGAWLRDHPQR